MYRSETNRLHKWSNVVVKCLALMASLVPVFALAQTSPLEMMGQGLYRLVQADKVSLETTGFEVRGRYSVQIKVQASLWHLPAEDKVKLELMTFEDGKLVSRQVADGHSLWNFDVRSNTYSSVVYSDEDGLARDWKQRVFRTLRLRSSGATAFTVRLLDDAFGTGMGTGKWAPWMPVSQVQRVDTNVSCRASSPKPSDTLYLLDGSDDEGFTLLGAVFDEYDRDRQRVERHWDLKVTGGKLHDTVDFGFVPPRGSKVVTVDQRGG